MYLLYKQVLLKQQVNKLKKNRGKSVKNSLYPLLLLKKSFQYPVASIFVPYQRKKTGFLSRCFVIFVDISSNK